MTRALFGVNFDEANDVVNKNVELSHNRRVGPLKQAMTGCYPWGGRRALAVLVVLWQGVTKGGGDTGSIISRPFRVVPSTLWEILIAHIRVTWSAENVLEYRRVCVWGECYGSSIFP